MFVFRDYSLRLGDREYTLRPTIGAMCAIEQESGFAVSSLAALLCTPSLPMPTLHLIFREGLKAAGTTPADDVLIDNALKQAAEPLCLFLLRGMGYTIMDKADINAGLVRSLRQPDWRDMFTTYVGIMGRPVQEFWCLTIPEYSLAVAGFCMMQDVEAGSAAPPATSQDIAEMLKRFPDRKSGEARAI